MTNSMELRKHCLSIDLAQKLKEFGFKQDSLFYWIFFESINRPMILFSHYDYAVSKTNHAVIYSAFTASELGEMLPKYISIGAKKNKKIFQLYFAKNEHSTWFVEYQEFSLRNLDCYEMLCQRSDETEVGARAKMLIYLIEEGYYKPLEV